MHVLVVLLLFVSLALLLALLYPMHRTSTLSFFNAITLQLFDAIFKDFFGLCEGSTEVPLKCWSIFCHGGMYNSHLHMYVLVVFLLLCLSLCCLRVCIPCIVYPHFQSNGNLCNTVFEGIFELREVLTEVSLKVMGASGPKGALHEPL